jgi:hypothetical protein
MDMLPSRMLLSSRCRALRLAGRRAPRAPRATCSGAPRPIVGNTKTNEEMVRIALDGLRNNRDYEIVVNLIEQLDPVPDISVVQSRLATTEQKILERKTEQSPRHGTGGGDRAYAATTHRHSSQRQDRPRDNRPPPPCPRELSRILYSDAMPLLIL